MRLALVAAGFAAFVLTCWPSASDARSRYWKRDPYYAYRYPGWMDPPRWLARPPLVGGYTGRPVYRPYLYSHAPYSYEPYGSRTFWERVQEGGRPDWPSGLDRR